MRAETEFFLKYGYYDYPRETVDKVIEIHEKFKTLEVVKVKDEIIGLARYNINGDTVEVLDAVIRPDYRFKNVLKLMLINGLKKWNVHFIEFERGLKDTRKRRFMIRKFLGVK